MRPDTQALLLVGGAAACLLAVVWRAVAHRRQTSKLVRRLEHAPEPADRARAGQEFIELGLRRAANPLLAAMEREADNRVRLSIALAVARRQWEPTRPTRVGRLRHWASEELEFQGHPVTVLGPAVTRLADMGGPRLPQPDPGPTQPAGAGADGGPPTAPMGVAPPPGVSIPDAPTLVMDPPRLDDATRPDALRAGGGDVGWAPPAPTIPTGP